MIRKTYTFRCPECGKHFRTDMGSGEPCCTGPSETRDEHELTIMHLHRVGSREINPIIGEMRAAGPLIIMEDY